MKIGIDGTPLTTPYPTGTRNYAENLLKGLAAIDKKNEYLIFSPSSVRIPKQKNFKIIYIPKIPVLKKQVLLPFLVKRNKVDIFHFLEPFGSIFLNHPKIITTVHDVDLNQTYPYKSKHFINRIYCELTRWMLARHSKSFITDTRSIGKELRKYLDILKIKSTIETIYLSPDKVFKYEKGLKIKQNYFLCMGDFALRKNIQTVISAYLDLSKHIKDNYKLKIITSTKESAKKFNHLIKKNRYGHKYIEVLINVSRNNLRDLYSNATAFIYPSLYEGFGLPILEAMACGCPVITSNYGAMKEIAGGAAILVNPKFSKYITKSMLKIVTNKKLRRDLINRGISRTKEFNWIKTAKQTLSIYTKVAKVPVKPTIHKFKLI